ncbi:MAG: aspartate/glutamate racemase family protein [Spirochaetota bacterium]
MKILWINPVGSDAFDMTIGKLLKGASRDNTTIDVISLPGDRPKHLEYHSYEGLVVGDIVNITYSLSNKYDGIVIGCFYDVGLREAREVSRRAIVTAPCESSLVFASHLGNSFSILVGRRKWIPKMRENVYTYGYGHRLASMRPLGMGVYDFQTDREKTAKTMMEQGAKAIEEDGAEVLILGCTIEFGFHEKMQKAHGVPVIDAVLAPFKLVELLSETAGRFGWYPSRKWGSEEPPEKEIREMGIFKNLRSTGNHLKDISLDR